MAEREARYAKRSKPKLALVKNEDDDI